jgi:hypothetical protein
MASRIFSPKFLLGTKVDRRCSLFKERYDTTSRFGAEQPEGPVKPARGFGKVKS